MMLGGGKVMRKCPSIGQFNKLTLREAPKCFNLGALSVGKRYSAKLFIPQLSGQLAPWELGQYLPFTVCMAVVSDFLDNM